MKLNYVVLDLETRESFRDVGSWNPSKLTVSVAGVYDARSGSEHIFRLEELTDLAQLLRSSERVVGFNLLGFDYAVLKSAFAQASADRPADGDTLFDPYTLPTVDVFDHLQRELGFRPKLDDVAAATLGRRKSGDGLQAIRLYQQGKWEELARYCLDDVRITKDVYEYGLQFGYVKFPMCDGRIADVKATWQPVPEQAPHQDKLGAGQARMF